MCELTAFSAKKPDEALMRDIVMVTVEGDQIKLRNVSGLEETLRGEIVKIDMLSRALFIEER